MINLTGCSILGCRLLFFSTLNISYHSFLNCKVTSKKSADSFMRFLLYVTWCFILATFKIVTRYVGSGVFLESFAAGQGQLLLVSGLGLLGRNYKVICGLLSIVMGLEVLGRGYAANQIWLSLVSGLGPFGGHHDVNWDQLSLVPNLWPLHWNYVLGQDQPPPMQGLGAHNGSYNASWDWLLCVLSLGPLSKRSKT